MKFHRMPVPLMKALEVIVGFTLVVGTMLLIFVFPFPFPFIRRCRREGASARQDDPGGATRQPLCCAHCSRKGRTGTIAAPGRADAAPFAGH